MTTFEERLYNYLFQYLASISKHMRYLNVSKLLFPVRSTIFNYSALCVYYQYSSVTHERDKGSPIAFFRLDDNAEITAIRRIHHGQHPYF
jgi:hypothetical protein